MYWRQSADARTMQNFMALSDAVQSTLNVLGERTSKWSAEVTMRKRGKEADAPGMFLNINAKDVAPEVFTCTLDARDAGGASGHAQLSSSSSKLDGPQPERTVLVLRAEKRCVEGAVPVKEYLARCRVHKLAHKCRIDGVEFWAGDFAVRIGRVENVQGTYAGTVVVGREANQETTPPTPDHGGSAVGVAVYAPVRGTR